MTPPQVDLEALKTILDNMQNPEALDAHPWVGWAFVKEAVAGNADLRGVTSGRQLALAVESIFSGIMPGVPPRRGKRLDTHWGEFGILAAQYFAPLRFGAPRPNSLRDAWGRIDKSILLYMFGSDADLPTDNRAATYKLVGDELEVAPNSTLSDWHRKGIEKLAEAIRARQQYLADHPLLNRDVNGADPKGEGGDEARVTAGQPQGPERGARARVRRKSAWRFVRVAFLILLFLILAAGVVGGFKAKRMYDQALLVWQDASQLRDLVTTDPSMETIQKAGPALGTLRQDYLALKAEAEPFLWLGPWLAWVPVYGGDLSSIQDLVALSDSLLASGDTAYQAVLPVVTAVNEPGFNPPRFAELLRQANPQLLDAQQKLGQAVEARNRLDLNRLSPRVRDLIANDVDRLIPLMQDGLIVTLELPRMVGATSEGPKTYLLLAQNADELRPTGGFITAAGTLLLQDGRISSLTFSNSGDLDNWQRPYPASPWQLSQYMDNAVLVLRDANWFTNYPTAALYAEYLYSYTNEHSVDGVIAFDQQALVEILQALGPIQVEGQSEPVDANNVIAYMRASKTPTAAELADPNWNNKVFINKITAALLAKIFAGDVDWKPFSKTIFQILNEHHLLLQLDNPALTPVLVRHGLDGVVRPGNGDFLMVVDSNVGFNKTNAVVETRLSYEVNLTDLSAPVGKLGVVHTNNAHNVPCLPYSVETPENIGPTYWEKDYPIDRCYWDYLRVYTPLGTNLLQANPQSIPAEWMIRHQTVPPQVDVLDEGIDGVQEYGLLKVVPGGRTMETDFRFGLPAGILKFMPESSSWVYHLRVQKQPGTVAIPITIRVVLPPGALLHSAPAGAVTQGGAIVLETNLREDVELEIQFSVP
jgi:hypothetical protein